MRNLKIRRNQAVKKRFQMRNHIKFMQTNI